MHGARLTDLSKLVYEWFKQHQSEGVPVCGPHLLEISEPCEFTKSGGLQKFK